MDKSGKAKRLGLLGGTFDPIHNAHIEIALIAKQRFNLDEVHFIVAKDPPIKEHVVLDAERRFQLVAKVLESYEGFFASRVELDRPGKSYSYLTVQHYKEEFSDLELFWIMGEDAFATLKTWKNFDYLKENLHFIVFNRTSSSKSEVESVNGLRVHYVQDFEQNLSSSKLRKGILESRLELEVPREIREKVLEYYRKD